MTTMTAKKKSAKKTKPAEVPENIMTNIPVDVSVLKEDAGNLFTGFDAKMTETAEKLVDQCSKVRVRCTWFSTSTKVGDDVIAEMTGMNPKLVKEAMSSSKRLLKSKHEALVAAKQAFQAVQDYVGSMTIPLIALRTVNDGNTLKKDAGVRVIRKQDMTDFDEKMNFLTGVLNTAAQSLQNALPQIIEEDRIRLTATNAKLFNVADYPSDVTSLIGVTWGFEPIGVDLEWEQVCPKIFERERLAAKDKYEAVVECAAVEFAKRFVQYVRQVTDQLGNRTRLRPVETRANLEVAVDDEISVVNADGAEVITLLRHEDEPDEIPEGHVLAELRLAKPDKGRSAVVWMAKPMKMNDFHQHMRPYSSDERKKLYASTVDNLKHELETFRNIGAMLGPYESVISDSVDKVRAMLIEGSQDMNSERIASELRDGTYFRTKMKESLEGVVTRVQAAMGEARNVRRKINKGLIGKV